MSSLWTSAHFRMGIGLLTILALPPIRSALEAGLVSHMLLQIPMLGYGGWLIGATPRNMVGNTLEDWDKHGVTGFVLAVCIALFWMLPRSIETSLEAPGHELAKFLSVPLAGFALARSFPRAPVLLRGLLLSHVVSMFGVLAWTFLAAPIRLCISYLASEQVTAGYVLLATGLAFSTYWGTQLLLCENPAWTSPRVETMVHQVIPGEAAHGCR